MRKRARIVAVVGIALALSLIGVFVLMAGEPEETFCTMGQAYRTVSIGSTDTDAVLEDQGSPGDDGCDIDASGPAPGGEPVLGYDCKVRDDGTVLASAEPNRSDGTCGQGDQSG